MEGRQAPETSTSRQSHIWVKCLAGCTGARHYLTTHLCKETDLSSRSWPPAPRGLGYSVSVHSVLRWQHRPLRSGALREVLTQTLCHQFPAHCSFSASRPRPSWWPLLRLPPSHSAPPQQPLPQSLCPGHAPFPPRHAPDLLPASLQQPGHSLRPPPSPAPACRLRPCLLPAPPQGRAPLLPRWGPPGVVRGPGAASGPTFEGRRCGTVPLFSRPGATAPFLRVSASVLGEEAGEAGVGSKE